MDRRTFLKTIPVAALAPKIALANVTAPKLKVHEWGTFTSIAGEDGAALDWLPLEGADDLPSFVYRFDGVGVLESGLRRLQPHNQKYSLGGTVRMETPVLYFYADEELDVDVEVRFPGGRITEWYPSARYIDQGIDWGRVHILPHADVALKKESAKSHYYPAREVDASIVRVCTEHGDEHDRFLFYRGVGKIDLPIRAELTGKDRSRVRVKNAGKKAILFENQRGRIGYRVMNGDGTYERPVLGAEFNGAMLELDAMLKKEKLFEKEAAAMLETWRDSWFEEGCRIFWIVPRAATDAILPLNVSPVPNELVRVLVGRTELITPETEHDVAKLRGKLASSDPSIVDEAKKQLPGHGRFAGAVLAHLTAR